MHKVAAKVVMARSRADTVNPFEPERPAMPAELNAGAVSLQSPEPLLTEDRTQQVGQPLHHRGLADSVTQKDHHD